jgi:NAD(P)H-dependent FMN reductase
MKDRKRIVVIAGSPKQPGKAVSDLLAEIAAGSLQDESTDVKMISIRKTFNQKKTDEAYQTMATADAMIIIFPLYVFCLPGITMRFLQSYGTYAASLPERKKTAVYAVVNCGFPEPEINGEAVRVVARFAQAVGAQFSRGVIIGGGGMLTMDVQPANRARENYAAEMKRIKTEIQEGICTPAENVTVRVRIPRLFYLFMGNMGWKRSIKKNGKKKKDLYLRPYQP